VDDGLAGLLRHRRPALAEVVRAADADRSLDPLFVRGRTRCVVAAETDARHPDPLEIDVVTVRQRVERRRHRDLVVRVDVRAEPSLALTGFVERQGRHPAREDDVLPTEELLLRRVQTREEQHQRGRASGRPAQIASKLLSALERDLDTFRRRVEVMVRVAQRLHCQPRRLRVSLHVEHPHKLREVVRERRLVPRTTGGEPATALFRLRASAACA
jgi:hypothetical protein